MTLTHGQVTVETLAEDPVLHIGELSRNLGQLDLCLQDIREIGTTCTVPGTQLVDLATGLLPSESSIS